MLSRRDEAGQALVIVMIVMLLLGIIAPVLVSQVASAGTFNDNNTDFESALAAAEAGVEQYKNLLDINSNYWQYYNVSGHLPSGGDDALTGWHQIDGATPPEAFHYIPNASALHTFTNGGNPGAVGLTVTGRGGSAGHYVYRTIEVTLQATGILSDAYYSDYEVLDPRQNTVTDQHGTAINNVIDPATGNPLWPEICQVYTYQQNSSVDSYDNIPDSNDPGFKYGDPAGPSYFGPFRGDTVAGSGNGNNAQNNHAQWNENGEVIKDPCGAPFSWTSGEGFTGPVYTKDQVLVCGKPSFGGGLETAAPGQDNFDSTWPLQNTWSGWSGQASSSNWGYNGWIYDYHTYWDGVGCFQNGADPGVTPQTGVEQNLPVTNSLLLTEAQTKGCVYTGPTMIEFVASGAAGGQGTFDVWSPLSGTPATEPANPACGSFASGPVALNLSIPAGGLLVYDKEAAAGSADSVGLAQYETSSDPALPSGATCLDPWLPEEPASGSSACPDATSGDLVVEGDVQGEVTAASADNIIVSRDLTYSCADAIGSPETLQTQPGFSLDSSAQTTPSCVTANAPDVLALVAQKDVVVSKPAGQNTSSEWPSPGQCTFDGVQTSTFSSSAAAQFLNQTVPNCDTDLGDQNAGTDGVVVDGAMIAVQGSYGDGSLGDYASGTSQGDSYLEGSDIGMYRGPWGQATQDSHGNIVSHGYQKNFNYDPRLSWLEPPYVLSIASVSWQEQTFVTCGGTNDIGVQVNSTTGTPLTNTCPGPVGMS